MMNYNWMLQITCSGIFLEKYKKERKTSYIFDTFNATFRLEQQDFKQYVHIHLMIAIEEEKKQFAVSRNGLLLISKFLTV